MRLRWRLRGDKHVADFLLRYADPRGQMHEQVTEAATERDAESDWRSRDTWFIRFERRTSAHG